MLLSKILIYIFQAYLLTNSNSWHVPFRMKMKSKYKNMVKLISKTRIYEKFGLTSLEIICKSLKITIITLNVYIFSCTDISRADTTSYDDTIVLTTLNSKISENLNAVEVEDLKSGSTTSTKLFSDEILMKFNDQELGLALTETSYKGFPVVTISRLTNENIGKTQPDLRIGAVITQVGSQKVDGLPLREIGKLVKSLDRPLDIKFRDPSRFFELLDSSVGRPSRLIRTEYLPANTRDENAPAQIISVQRLEMPRAEDRLQLRTSQYLDVMEIQYVAQIEGTNNIVDSSADRAPPGTSSRSIYYVLGQRNGPPGKYPPGWDLTLRGMYVGEKRRIVLPYTLAYDRKGLPEKNIPPYANIVYTVRLISLT